MIDIAHLIQSSVAPVFLLSGVAATLGVLTNRLSRIVDRARLLEKQLAGPPGETPHLHDDLAVLARRAHYITARCARPAAPPRTSFGAPLVSQFPACSWPAASPEPQPA